MRDGLRLARDSIDGRPYVFNFLPLLASRCSLAGISKKLKKSSSAIFATRSKRAVSPCLNNDELISKRLSRYQISGIGDNGFYTITLVAVPAIGIVGITNALIVQGKDIKPVIKNR